MQMVWYAKISHPCHMYPLMMWLQKILRAGKGEVLASRPTGTPHRQVFAGYGVGGWNIHVQCTPHQAKVYPNPVHSYMDNGEKGESGGYSMTCQAIEHGMQEEWSYNESGE